MRRLAIILGVIVACGSANAETSVATDEFIAMLKIGKIASDLGLDYGYWMTAGECERPLPAELLSFLKARIRENEAKLPKERQEEKWRDAWGTKLVASAAGCKTVTQALERDHKRHLELEKQGKIVPPKPDF
ncbi:hypothetical protein [Camelimonas lactis]|uniref:Uncharacterized protein n=1 Tax=Camelimonas lactis TaxID=659006 RepID=A0A4R2GI60_9HYPH|nr:hypothetical protein [Camelimonas lactis]TCO07550.1 hypothetical protein EV666_1317 [Camelimonas lactis]